MSVEYRVYLLKWFISQLMRFFSHWKCTLAKLDVHGQSSKWDFFQSEVVKIKKMSFLVIWGRFDKIKQFLFLPTFFFSGGVHF